MKDLPAIQYLCGNLSGLSGVPVRLYKNKEQVAFYSPVHLEKDPFELDQEEALAIEEDLYYFESPYSCLYGILRFDEYSLVAGPIGSALSSKPALRSIAFSLGVAPASAEEYVAVLESLPSLPLLSLLQILCMVDFALTGKQRSLESVAIAENQQAVIKEEMEKGQTERTLENLEHYKNRPYPALDIENQLMDMVMRGDVAAIQRFASTAPAIEGGKIAHDQLRQMKNTFVVTVTLVSRAAIRGGMDVTAALALSDAFIQRCELADNARDITQLSYRALLDYAERVAQIRLGQNPSPTVIKVSNYVQQHLSEPIKVEDIANALFMGRSRLSTNFKKETGMGLAEYITMIKINEAKRMLRYSDKSFATISLYLGFSSQSHFTRTFKKVADMTPFEYRQLHKHY